MPILAAMLTKSSLRLSRSISVFESKIPTKKSIKELKAIKKRKRQSHQP